MPEGATIIGRVAVKVIPDTENFREDTQTALDVIERELNSIKIHFTADWEQARDEVKDAIDRAQHEADDINLHLDISEPSKRETQAEISWLTRARKVTIYPELNKAATAKVVAGLAALSGVRTVRDLAEDFRDWVASLDRAIPAMAAVATGITNIGAASLAGTSNILAFGSSLATIVPAGLALPGIIGGIATGMGAFVAVMLDFNERLPEVGDNLAKLQDQMSNRFWSRAEVPMRRFFESILPQFSAGIRQTSADLGTFFARLSRSATNVFDGELTQMFEDLNESILIASRFTDNFVGIIQKLGAVGAGNLPRLAGWFGDISKRFDGWLGDKGQNGLQEYVDTGIEALEDLGGVIKNTSTLFAGLARAAEAAGGGSLDSLNKLLASASDTVNGDRFQAALTDAFRGAHEAMDELTNRSGKQFESLLLRISDLLTTVLPTAGRAAGDALGGIFAALDQDNVQASVEGLFTKLEESINNLVPALNPVADGLAGIIDLVGDVTVNLSRALGPALGNLGTAVADLSVDLKPLVEQLGDLLVHAVSMSTPVVTDLAQILGEFAGILADILAPLNDFLDVLRDLPDPIKSVASNLAAVGILAGGAAWLGMGVRAKVLGLADSLLAAGINSRKAEGAFITTAAAAERVGARMTGVKLGLAGAALALGGLAVEASGSNRAMQAITTIGGAAMTGYFVGGPWGAAIGAGVSGLMELIKHNTITTDSIKAVVTAYEGVGATLNQMTGATTESTRAFLYDEAVRNGAMKTLTQYGIAGRTVIDAIMGEKHARDEVRYAIQSEASMRDAALQQAATLQGEYNAVVGTGTEEDAKRAAINELILAYQNEATEHQNVIDGIRDGMGALKAEREAIRLRAVAITDYGKVFKGAKIPKKVVTDFETNGIPATVKGLANLQLKYDLTPKQLKTIVSVAGLDVSLKRIKNLVDKAKEANRTKVDLPAIVPGVTRAFNEAAAQAGVGSSNIAKAVRRETRKTKAEMPELNQSVRTAASQAAGVASAESPAIGQNMKSGMISGFSGASEELAAIARSAVRAALDAANAEADSHSPSREFMKVGAYMGQGLTIGYRREARKAVDVSVFVISRALRAAMRTATKFHKSMSKDVTQLRNKYEQVFKKVGAAQKKQLKEQLQGILKTNRAYESQWKAIEKAQQRLKSLIAEAKAYRQQVTDQIVATGDPTRDGASSFEAIINILTVARDEAVKFADVIAQLAKAELNKDTIAQLVAAGPEAALAAAQAILSSGQVGIEQINDLMEQIRNAGKDLGQTASTSLFGEQIAATKADLRDLLKAIKPLAQRLAKAVEEMMNKLVKEIKKGNRKIDDEVAKTGKGGSSSERQGDSNTRPRTASNYGLGTGGSTVNNTLNYYAAPGPALSSEESLFSAAKRGRMVFAS